MVIVVFCSVLIYLLYGMFLYLGVSVLPAVFGPGFFLGVRVCVSCVPVQGLCHPVQAPQGLTAPQTELVILSCTPCINKNNFCFLCEPAQSAAIPHPFETPTAREGTEYWGWGRANPTPSPMAGRWHRAVCGV